MLDRWLRLFEARSLERIPIGGFKYEEPSDGHRYFPRQAYVVSQGGFLVLVEKGTSSANAPHGYIRLRIAALLEPGAMPRGGHAAEQVLASAGELRAHRFGLSIVARWQGHDYLVHIGQEAAVRALVDAAKARAGKPFLELRAAPPDALARFAFRASDEEERTLRCDTCGAPVALSVLAAQGTDSCPYCGSGVRVSSDLARELVRFRQRLSIQNAMGPLDVERLWKLWNQSGKAGVLACVVCGAPKKHTPGSIGSRCGHCGAAIIPSEERLEADVSMAREARHAQEQRAHGRVYRRVDAGRSLSFVAGTFNLAMALGVASSMAGLNLLVTLGNYSRNGDVVRLLGRGSISFGMMAPVVVIIGYVALRWWRQRRRWPPVWAGLAEQLGGERVGEDGTLAWLYRWWVGAPERGGMMYGLSGASGAVASDLDGQPALIEGDVENDVGVYRRKYGRPWLRIYIACRWSPKAPLLMSTEGVRARRTALHRGGFQTCLRRGGIEVTVTAAVRKHLKQHPHATAILAPVAWEARRIMRLLGASAPPPRD